MKNTIKHLLIVLLVIVILVVLVFHEKLGINLGAIFASITGGFAVFKSKLFNSSTVEEQIEAVENEHFEKRENWQNMKEEFDSKYSALKARMDYIDYKSALILSEISNLDEEQKKAVKKDLSATHDELVEFLNR